MFLLYLTVSASLIYIVCFTKTFFSHPHSLAKPSFTSYYSANSFFPCSSLTQPPCDSARPKLLLLSHSLGLETHLTFFPRLAVSGHLRAACRQSRTPKQPHPPTRPVSRVFTAAPLHKSTFSSLSDCQGRFLQSLPWVYNKDLEDKSDDESKIMQTWAPTRIRWY